MINVPIRYGVIFGKGDATDWIEYEISLDGKEEEYYNQAVKLKKNPNDVPELKDALQRAYDEIEEMEIENCIGYDDEYVIECQGRYPVEAETINELVAKRDEYTIDFFDLSDMTEEQLDDWDANDLEELPDVCDFDKDFEPISPYDEGWTLNVEFDSDDEY